MVAQYEPTYRQQANITPQASQTSGGFAYLLLILIIISANNFFNPFGFMDERTIKAWFYGISTFSFIFAVFSKNQFPKQYRLKKWFILLIISLLGAAFMATLFQEQSISVSIMSILGTFFGYLSYYTFVKLDVSHNKIIYFLLVISLLSVIMYACNALTFPNEMFGGYNEIRDGDDPRGARVTVPMLNAMVVMIFFGIQQIMENKKKIWIFAVILFSTIIVLSLWRQVIFLTFAISFGYILWKVNFLKKILLCISVGCIGIFLLPKIPIYQTLKEITEIQADRNLEKEDIRVFDYKYFCNDAQANSVTRIFGNGVPSMGNSQWGNQIENEWYYLRTFPVDVGWAGFYWSFGILAVVGLLMLFYKSFKIASNPQKNYIRLSILYFVLESIANGPILNVREIIIVSLVLYLAIAPDKTIEIGKDYNIFQTS